MKTDRLLKPLGEWICDNCGEIILEPEHGWVEWFHGEDASNPDEVREVRWGFRIVHHSKASPQGQCRYPNSADVGDMHLERVLGQKGLDMLLSIMITGIKDAAEYARFMRRLQIPYYEQARAYLDEAVAYGYANPETTGQQYTAEDLRAYIERFNK